MYNLTGVIKKDSNHDYFLIEFIADLAKPDAIFDADSNMAWITTIA
jgi:hypothetical protein